MLAHLFAAALLAAALPAAAAPAAPSFDCAKAAGFAEKAVCADPGLSRRDRDLAALYGRALASVPDPAWLRRDERQALAQRAACADRACVESWYAVRRATLGRAAALHWKIGQCERTRITELGSRLEGVPGSGAFVSYADALNQVSYETLPGAAGSRVGDPVRLCLRSRPRHCPAGDTRGALFAARNLRTGATWSAADSEHMCGGA